MNHVMRRRKLNLVSKAGFVFVLLSVRALSASGPSGNRRKTWRDLVVRCKNVNSISSLKTDILKALGRTSLQVFCWFVIIFKL